MIKVLLRKSWIVGLTVLFIVGGLTFNIGADDIGSPVKGTTWYIDDDAVPPYQGTINNPFKYIWQGIENATSGDDISIASGTYYECIYLDKELTLKWYGDDILGDDTGKPIINGGYESSVIEIHASGVDLVEIIIVASKKTGRNAGIYIEEGVKNIKIDDCEITDCYYGIWSHRTKADEIFHTYIDNKIDNIDDSGILAHFSDELDILNNQMMDCGYCGILLLDCEKCVIRENTCKNNQNGIAIDVGRKNEVIENTCDNNDKWGFYVVNGLLNTIKSNNFMNNGYKGQATWVEDKVIGSNQWTNNYWGRSSFVIHIIFGALRRGDVDYPWFRLDLFPSSSPIA